MRLRQGIDALQLGDGLDVEAQDVCRQRPLDLALALADAREHDFRRACTGCQHAFELSTGNDVEAGAEPRQHIEHGEVGVRLHRIADQRGAASECVCIGLVGRGDGRARVDVERRAEAGCKLSEGDALAMQFAVPVIEADAHGPRRRHLLSFVAGTSGKGRVAGRSAGRSAGAFDWLVVCGGGKVSGPFCPQPASAASAANTRMRGMAVDMVELTLA